MKSKLHLYDYPEDISPHKVFNKDVKTHRRLNCRARNVQPFSGLTFSRYITKSDMKSTSNNTLLDPTLKGTYIKPSLITELPQIDTIRPKFALHNGIKCWVKLTGKKKVPYEKLQSQEIRSCSRKRQSSEDCLLRKTIRRLLVKRISERNEFHRKFDYRKNYYISNKTSSRNKHLCNSVNGQNSTNIRKKEFYSILKLHIGDKLLMRENTMENSSSDKNRRELHKNCKEKPQIIENSYYKHNYTPVCTSPSIFKYKRMTVAELWHSLVLQVKGLATRGATIQELSPNYIDRIKKNVSIKELSNSYNLKQDAIRCAIEKTIRKARIKTLIKEYSRNDRNMNSLCI